MKKILLCLVLAVALSNCELNMQTTNAQEPTGNNMFNNIEYTTIHGMQYAIVYAPRESNGAAVGIINLTKDSLEIVYLKNKLQTK